MGSFAINVDDDLIFRIKTDHETAQWPCTWENFGDDYTQMEVYSSNDGHLLKIDCIYLGPVGDDPNLRLPDCRSDPDLLYFPTKCIHPPHGEYGCLTPCSTNLIRQEFVILFEGNPDIVDYYHKDGRVEYYYSMVGDLQYIKVVDLTDEEYEFLSRWIE